MLQSSSFKPLAQLLIRLSAFKLSLGEQQNLIRQRDKEKRKAGGGLKKKANVAPLTNQVLWSSEAGAALEKTLFQRNSVRLTLVSTLPAPRRVKRFRPSLCKVGDYRLIN